MGRRAFVAFVLAILSQSPLVAQKPRVEIYTIGQGLPSSTIYDLEQDADGRLWILTRAGLTLFDGRTFTPSESIGLVDRDLRAIEIDAVGTVWAVSSRPDTLVFRLDGDRWAALPNPTSRVDRPAPGLVVDSIVVDGRTTLALGWPRTGLRLWDGEWSDFEPGKSGLEGGVRAIAGLGDRFAIGTDNGLCWLEDRKPDCDAGRIDPRLGGTILALATVRRPGIGTRLWILTPTWLGHLEFDGESERLTVVVDDLKLGFEAERSGVLGVDTVGGVYFGDEATLRFLAPGEVFPRLLGARDGLAADGLTSILIDREAHVWLGGMRGLSMVESRRFVSYDRSQGLLEDEVTAIVASGGRIVLGHNRGFSILGARDIGQIRFNDRFDGIEGLNTRVMDLAVDPDGRVRLATTELGLLEYDPVRDVLRRLDAALPAVISVENDPRGGFWVAGYDEVRRMEPGRDVSLPVDFGDSRRGFIRWLTADVQGRLWVSTFDGLFWRRPDGSWSVVRGRSVASSALFGVLADSEDVVWVGSSAGLLRLVDGALVPADEVGGPKIEQPVYFLLRGGQGRLWIGTDDGVHVWDGRQLVHRTVRHGLVGRETNRGAGFLDPEGQVWIGTDRGVSLYQSRYDNLPLGAPNVVLRAVEVNGAMRAPTDLGRLQYWQGNLTFNLGAVSFSGEEDLLLRYRLEGFDDVWIGPVPFAAASVRYTNVPSGEYRFRVAARWSGGPWSPEAVTPPIRIARPLWRKPWFLILAVGIFVLAIFAGHDLRTRTIRQRNSELERVNAELERSMGERDRAEAALRESEERYRSVITSMSEGIIVYDTELRPLAFNESAERILGLSSRQMAGHGVKPDWRTVHEDGRPLLPDEYPALVTLRDGRPRQGLVYGIDHPGGRRSWIALNTRPIRREPAISPHAVVMSFTDITERKAAEAERERLIEDLAAKNLELERFTYTVSHDLRAPLVTIQGFLGMLRRDIDGGDAERIAADFARIGDAARKMGQLLEQLLELSRIGRVIDPSDEVDLGEVVREAAEMIDGKIEARHVEVRIDDPLPRVRGDRVRLRQVFQNLIENAVKFQREDAAPCIEIGARRDPLDGAVCWVRDNGIGIAAEFQARIFGLFERVDGEVEGSGVGLTLVQRIVEGHGGRIRVESEGSGRGSTFIFSLPEILPPAA